MLLRIGEWGPGQSGLGRGRAQGAAITCTVWTRNNRASIVPFGDDVLWSVYMEQSWGYDDQRVV
jgi:hypothetical protein